MHRARVKHNIRCIVYVYRALTVHQYTPLFSFKAPPSSVHLEHRELDQRHRPTREREVRQRAGPQPPLREREREDVVHHARPELRVPHERGELEHGARERRDRHVRWRAHASRHARAMGKVQDGERAGGLARMSCVMMNGRRASASSWASA
jgi:hypothetical protein